MQWLETRRQEQWGVIHVLLMRLKYAGIKVAEMTPDEWIARGPALVQELAQQLAAEGREIPHINIHRLVAMLRSLAIGGTEPDQDIGHWRPERDPDGVPEGIPYDKEDEAEKLRHKYWGSYKFRDRQIA